MAKENSMAKKKRLHLFVSGRVQGVFYRSFIESNARQLGVKGWVRNLADGRVEIVAEGDEMQLYKLLGLCKQGPDGAQVMSIDKKSEEYKGEFQSFITRY